MVMIQLLRTDYRTLWISSHYVTLHMLTKVKNYLSNKQTNKTRQHYTMHCSPNQLNFIALQEADALGGETLSKYHSQPRRLERHQRRNTLL